MRGQGCLAIDCQANSLGTLCRWSALPAMVYRASALIGTMPGSVGIDLWSLKMPTNLATSNTQFWNRQLDKLKELGQCNDSGLARTLGVSRQYISKWRSGQQIPAKSKIRILDLLSYTITFDAVLGLLDDEIADRLRNADFNRIRTLIA